jgi:hypothetical protein
MTLVNASSEIQCPWLIIDKRSLATLDLLANPPLWIIDSTVQHPSDPAETLILFRRAIGPKP